MIFMVALVIIHLVTREMAPLTGCSLKAINLLKIGFMVVPG